jgi:hypothetical protein
MMNLLCNRVFWGYDTILPISSKSPSQNPILDNILIASVIDFNGTLNQFKNKMYISIESSLVVEIKPSRDTYHKLYPSHLSFMKARNGWRILFFINLETIIVNLSRTC